MHLIFLREYFSKKKAKTAFGEYANIQGYES